MAMEDRPFKALFGDEPTKGFTFKSARPESLPMMPTSPQSPGFEIYSPMTSLAMNLNEKLNTSCDDTPKRNLSSLLVQSPPPYDPTSAEVASITDNARSPLSFDALDNDESPKSSKVGKARGMRRMKTCFRRVKSMTVESTSPNRCSPKRPLSSPLSGSYFKPSKSPRQPLGEISRPILEEENSQDSGLGCDKDKASLDDFRFATPVGLPPRRYHRVNSQDSDTNSPLRYSPVSDNFSPQCLFPRSRAALSPSFESTAHSLMKSPMMRAKSTESTGNDSDDDGFLELIDIDDDDQPSDSAPKGLSSLLNAPLMNQNRSSNKENTAPTPKRGNPRGLFRSPSAPRLGVHLSPSPCSSPFELYSRPLNLAQNNKRPEPCSDDSTPVVVKRRKSVVEASRSEENTAPVKKATPKFQRSISDSETQIKYALSRPDQAELIGDFSRSYCLPTIPSKKQDLKAISPETMADLLDDKYKHIVEEFVVVDCRYPYEYDGGHIKGARNYYTKDDIISQLLKAPLQPRDADKRVVIIFHCEFSSERGPGLMRFLRSQDRLRNNENYPNLYYPELYLLEGGYKAFWEKCPTYNFPQAYKHMLHEDHSSDLRHFRAKSKSWAGEKCGGRSIRSGLKF